VASNLEQALDDAVRSVPDCLIAGYVDLPTGVLLGVKTMGKHPQEALDLISSTVADLFGQADLSAVENWLLDGQEEATPGANACQEFVVMSDELLHMYTRCKDNDEHAVVLIARKSANVGMLISKSRKAAGFITNAA
jgi:hypothetical protein